KGQSLLQNQIVIEAQVRLFMGGNADSVSCPVNEELSISRLFNPFSRHAIALRRGNSRLDSLQCSLLGVDGCLERFSLFRRRLSQNHGPFQFHTVTVETHLAA